MEEGPRVAADFLTSAARVPGCLPSADPWGSLAQPSGGSQHGRAEATISLVLQWASDT